MTTEGYVVCESCDGDGGTELCAVCRLVVDNCSCEEHVASVWVECTACGGSGELEPDPDEEEEEAHAD